MIARVIIQHFESDGGDPDQRRADAVRGTRVEVEWLIRSFVYLIICAGVALLGRKRRIGFIGFFIFSVLFTPVIVLLILLLTAPKRERRPVSSTRA